MSIFLLFLGLILAAIGGERFVRGAVGLAMWLRVPAGIVGATIAAFATSSPELTVGTLSAIDNQPELALGDATGSNMVNLGVVLGVTLLFASMRVQRQQVQRELVGFIAALSLLLISSVDGRIVRTEAIVMIVIFMMWLLWLIRDVRRDRNEITDVGETRRGVVIADVVLGLTLLMLSGRLIVVAAKDIGELLGWSQFVMGSIVVAIGTSTPELVTTIVSARKGHLGVGIGTVLGSNIFNSLLIVGVAGWIKPIEVDFVPTLVAITAAFCATVVSIPSRQGSLSRIRGASLLFLYFGFVCNMLVFQ